MAHPTPEQINTRAYQLWELAGAPDGRDAEFWHEAERELTEKEGEPESDAPLVPGA